MVGSWPTCSLIKNVFLVILFSFSIAGYQITSEHNFLLLAIYLAMFLKYWYHNIYS